MSGLGVGAVSLQMGNLRSPGAVEGQLILNKASHLIFWTFPQPLGPVGLADKSLISQLLSL